VRNFHSRNRLFYIRVVTALLEYLDLEHFNVGLSPFSHTFSDNTLENGLKMVYKYL